MLATPGSPHRIDSYSIEWWPLREQVQFSLFPETYLRPFPSMEPPWNDASFSSPFFFLYLEKFFFSSFVRCLLDASFGEKNASPRPRGISSDILFMNHLFFYVHGCLTRSAMRDLLNKTSIRASPINFCTADRFTSRPCRTDI